MSIIVLLAWGWAGWLLMRRYAPPEPAAPEAGPTGPVARLNLALLSGLGGFMASGWLLSLPGLLGRPALLVTPLLMLVILGWAARRNPRPSPPGLHLGHLMQGGGWLALGLIAAWLAYGAWKLWILPVCNTDALYIDMPRAVWILKSAGRFLWEAPPESLKSFYSYHPNASLFAAQVMLLDGHDRLVELVSWIPHLWMVLLSLELGLRLGLRGRPLWGGLALACMAPLLLLHTATLKSDVMTGALVVQVLLLASRWRSAPSPRLLALALLAGGLALGFKRSAVLPLFAVSCLSLPALWRVRDHLQPTPWFRALALGAVASLAAGAGHLLLNKWRVGSYFGFHVEGLQASSGGMFQWLNLLEIPAILAMAPFGGHGRGVWLPWRSEYWYWPSQNLFAGHFGLLPALAFLLLALALLPKVRRHLPEGAAWWLLAGGATWASVLCTAYGAPSAFGRFTLFVLPVMALALVAPLGRALAPAPLRATAYRLLICLLLLQCFHTAIYDAYAPHLYLQRLHRDPGARRIVHAQPDRPALVFDRLAPARARVAVEPTYQAWLYPLWGEGWTRHVTLVTWKDQQPVFDPATEWVVVDNIASQVWVPERSTPAALFHSMGTGTPGPRDLALSLALKDHPDWETLFWVDQGQQAVFRRRKVGTQLANP